MISQEQIAGLIRFDEKTDAGVVAYEINGKSVGDSWKKIKVIYNGSAEKKSIVTGNESWKIFSTSNQLQVKSKSSKSTAGSIVVEPYSASILYQN
jgi:hypothetical protein